MIRCRKCGHQNLPQLPHLLEVRHLARWGERRRARWRRTSTPLASPPSGPPAARRKRTLFLGVALAALGVFGWRWSTGRRSARATPRPSSTSPSAGWSWRSARSGLFWNCVMASEVDVGMFSNADQIQQRIEAAYLTQQKTFSEHLLTECVPKMERARQAFAGLHDAAGRVEGARSRTTRPALPELQKRHRGLRRTDQEPRRHQGRRPADPGDRAAPGTPRRSPTPETIAFEKFMHCAVPGLDKMKDTQQLLEYLADACYKKDPVPFMDRVRKDCGPLLESADAKATPPKTYKAVAEALLRRGRAPAAGLGQLRPEGPQGQEGRGPGRVPGRGRRLHEGPLDVKKAAQALEDASS